MKTWPNTLGSPEVRPVAVHSLLIMGAYVLVFLTSTSLTARARLTVWERDPEHLQELAEQAACALVYITRPGDCHSLERQDRLALTQFKKLTGASGSRLRIIFAPQAACDEWQQEGDDPSLRAWLLVYKEGCIVAVIPLVDGQSIRNPNVVSRIKKELGDYMSDYALDRWAERHYPRRNRCGGHMSHMFGGYYAAWAVGPESTYPWGAYSQGMGFQRCP